MDKAVLTIAQIRCKLVAAEPITDADLTALAQAVRQHTSPANVALYSQAKRAANDN